MFTSDEFINKVNFQMYPFSFIFVANSYGITASTSETNYIKRTQSLNGDQTADGTIGEYRVFLNDPDRSVWPNTTLAPPKVQVWTEDTLFMDYNYNRNPLYLPLDIQQVVMEKNRPNDCPYEGVAIFKIESNIDGYTAILIDVDKNGTYSSSGSDRVIYRNMKKGLNYVIWNFKTDAGATVAVGNYNASATFLGRGPAHFPLYDVEQMDGVTTSSIRPFIKLKTTIYWDDSRITRWGDQSGGDLMNETQRTQLVVGKDVRRMWSWHSNLEGTAHNGNMNTMNTWFNAIDLGYSTIGLKVQQSATKCVDGLAPWVGDIYKEGLKNTNIAFTKSDFTFKFFDPREYALDSIIVLSLPVHGTLKLSGANVDFNQIVKASMLKNLTYTPTANWFGKDNFEWKGHNSAPTDARWSNNQENVYLIINTPPTITDIPDQTLCTNTPTLPIAFTIGDNETINDVVVTGFSADPAFVSNTGIVIGGSGANRTITVTPVKNKSGMSIIYIMADDGLSQTIEQFTVYVGPDLQFSGDTTVCTTQALSLTAQEMGASYSWKFNGEEKSAFQSVNQAAGSVSVGTWSLTVTKGGCTSTRDFTVSTSPNTTFTGDVNACTGEAISLSANEVNASYIWKKGTTQVSTFKTYTIPSAATTDAGEYTLYVSKNSCNNTSPQFTISVINSPNPGLAVSGNTVDPGVAGTITISNAQNGIKYNVYKGGGFVISGTGADANLAISISPADLAIGDNIFTIKADNGNCEVPLTNTATIHVNTPGITVSAISRHTSEDGVTATFTVRLNTKPSVNVVIPIHSDNVQEGKIDPETTTSLTFTPTSYGNQTVTVKGVDDHIIDGIVQYKIITDVATSTDGYYSGMNADDVVVYNDDNDYADVTISAISGNTTEAGGKATFTVVLKCQPSVDVTIDLSSTLATEGVVSLPVSSSLTFTPSTWNTPQTVEVTGQNDYIDEENLTTYYIEFTVRSADANFNGLAIPHVMVKNEDNDTAGIFVNASSGLTTSEAGGTATFTIKLTSQPTGNVTVKVYSNNPAEGTVTFPAPVLGNTILTFTPGNWGEQQVIVTGVDDDVDEDNISYKIITDPSASTDPKYFNINPIDIDITNTDNDDAGLMVSKTSITTSETGGFETFTVRLNTQPTSTIVIGIVSSKTNEGTVSPASLAFTTTDWSTPKVVTVTGVDDDIVDDPLLLLYDVTVSVNSGDSKYLAVANKIVNATNTDNDIASVTVTPTSIGTSEDLLARTFSLMLTSKPSANVTISFTGIDVTEGSISVSSVVFTPDNWNQIQEVTVTGLDDAIDDGNIAYTISTTASSSDSHYDAIDVPDVEVSNADNDTAGITVSSISNNTTEALGINHTATFTIALNTRPLQDVTISTIASTNTGEGTVSPTSVTFTNANWAAKTITVTGVNDDIDDDNKEYGITISNTISSDANYDNKSFDNVSVWNIDDDTKGITVSTINHNTTEAAGANHTAIFTIVLNSQPTASVSIALSSSDTGEGTVASPVNFTTGNWNIPQTVTVTGVNDNLADGEQPYQIASVASGGDYNGVSAAGVLVSNIDDDRVSVTVSTISNNTTEAPGANHTATFTIVLDCEPTAGVTIGLSSSNTGEGRIAPITNVQFTTGNWNTPQTVTVTGVDDYIDDGNVGYSIITAPASGGDYTGFDADNVAISNIDNDNADIIVTPPSYPYTVEDGQTTSFKVRLNSQPTASVTIDFQSDDEAEGKLISSPSPLKLTYTTTNWNQDQEVVVTGQNDDVDDNDQSYDILISPAVSSDAKYSGLSLIVPKVSLTNKDNDDFGVIVNPTSLEINEAGSAKTFTVVLKSKPTHSVTIGLHSDNTGKGTVFPTSITFTSVDWKTPKEITVTPVDNYIDDDEIDFTIVTYPATSDDVNYKNLKASDVAVRSIDNDEAKINVTPISGNTSEDLTSATFTIALNSQPTDDVTIGISSDDPGEGDVDISSVTFTDGNWSTPITVTVTGVNDDHHDGNQTYHIVFAAALSSDFNYNGITPDEITVINSDNDTPGVTVFPVNELITTEAGGYATFTVRLNSQPTANVNIGISSSDESEGKVSLLGLPVTMLTFTSADWNIQQTVKITGEDDLILDGDIPFTIQLANAVSDDVTGYSGINVPDVSVTNKDDVEPRAFADAVETTEDTGVAINVLDNDKGLDVGGLVLSISQQSGHGSLTINADKTITYQPNGLFNGLDTFKYRVCDGNSKCDEATVTVTVKWMDDSPVAMPDARGTSKNTPVVVDVLFNDYGMEDGSIVVAIDEAATHGTAVVNPGNPNTILFTPTTGYIGLATFIYKITDTDLDSDTAKVTINVREVNTVPDAIDDAVSTIKNKSIEISVLANDIGLNDGFKRLDKYSTPAHGTVVVNATRTITYTPATDYIGNDSFRYLLEDVDGDYDIATVNITVTEKPNYLPKANPDRRGTNYQTAVKVDVLINDTGLEDGVKDVTISSDPVNGNVVVNGDNTVTYTPDDGFSGVETFIYQVSDNDNQRSSATVTITVLPDGVTNHIPDAVDDAATTVVNAKVDISVLSNDKGLEDGFGDLMLFSAPRYGTAIVNDNRTVSYTPSNLFVGEDSFQYWVEDIHGDKDIATVTVSVTERQNHKPLANDDKRATSFNLPVTVNVLINDTGLEDEPIVVSLETLPNATEGTAAVNTADNTITFTPFTDYIGFSSFKYRVTDKDGESDDATVTINVKDGINNVPEALDDAATTIESRPVSINVLANDTHLEDGIESLIIHRLPKYGTVVVNANYTLTYTPSPWFVGADDFDYLVSDVDGDYGIAKVSITVNAKVNSNPVANNDSRGTSMNTAVVVDVLANDSGLDDGGLVITISSNPTNGSVDVNSDNTVTYTPNTDYLGVDHFTYQVCDINNDCSTATVTINVKENNFEPQAQDDIFFTKVNTSGIFNVLDNDTGLDDGGIKVELLNQVIAGQVTVNSDNTISYTPLAGFDGVDNFSYKVTDIDGDCDTARVTVIVTSGVIPGFSITPSSLTTSEDGTSASVYVTLTSAPASDVSISMTSGDLTEGTVNPSILTFTPANWDVAQTVTVTGVNDFIIDNSVVYKVTASVVDAVSDNYFDPLFDQTVEITNTDNDVAGFTISKTTANTNEMGVDDNFTVVLNAQPYSDVVISVTPGDITEGSVDKGTLTFSSANWNTPQTITVSGVKDYLVDGNITYNITLSIVDESSDNNFDPLADQVVVVTNTDNNLPVAVDDDNSINENETDIIGNILNNDTDEDNEVLNILAINGSTSIASIAGSYGLLACDVAGNYTYTLDNNNGAVKDINNGQILTDTFTYIVTDGNGGSDTASLVVTINGNTNLEDIHIPRGFSPDGDGISDIFVIPGLENYPDNELTVYNRWGSKVFNKKQYKDEWGGYSDSSKGKLPVGTYFYVLKANGKTFSGYVYIKY